MENQQQVQIKASDSDLKGLYSNAMQVRHTQEEFVLDFFNLLGTEGVLASRMIVSPAHLKRITQALEENMKRYEDQFGVVIASAAPNQDIGFKPQ